MKPLFITGATGWLGRSVLDLLYRSLPRDDFQYIVPFASRRKIIRLSTESNRRDAFIQAYPLSEISALASGVNEFNLIHAAFLTRDRIQQLGIERYIDINRRISSYISQLFMLKSCARSVLFSSGAVAELDRMDRCEGIVLESNPYAFLKRDEERIFARHPTALILRVYALTGRYIRTPQNFALGSFLLSAMAGQAIHVLSKRPVVRGYVSAADVSALSWAWLQSSDDAPSAPIDAVSDTLDLLTLAHQITLMYRLPSVRHLVDPALMPDFYSASMIPFVSWLKRYGLFPTSLELQISDTYAGMVSNRYNLAS